MQVGDLVKEKPQLAPSEPRIGIITYHMSGLFVVQWVGEECEDVVEPAHIYIIGGSTCK